MQNFNAIRPATRRPFQKNWWGGAVRRPPAQPTWLRWCAVVCHCCTALEVTLLWRVCRMLPQSQFFLAFGSIGENGIFWIPKVAEPLQRLICKLQLSEKCRMWHGYGNVKWGYGNMWSWVGAYVCVHMHIAHPSLQRLCSEPYDRQFLS